MVKEIECEREYNEKIIRLQQYENARPRKRARISDTQAIPTLEDRDVVLHADMYDDPVTAAVVTPALADDDGESIEDGLIVEVEAEARTEEETTEKSTARHLANGALHDAHELPDLPSDVEKLPKLPLSSPLLLQPGTVIAFKHMEMHNFMPRHSAYKTARVVESWENLLLLELAKRDREEAMYDYEGARVHGPFDVVDGAGDVIEGRMKIEKDELMDVVLLSS